MRRARSLLILDRRRALIAVLPLRRARRASSAPAFAQGFAVLPPAAAVRVRRDRAAARSRGCSGSRRSTTSCSRSACNATLHNALLVAGRRLARDAVPGDARRRRHEAGADRLPVPRTRRSRQSLLLAFSVGMNIALVVFNLVLGADRAVPDGAHAALEAPARRGSAGREDAQAEPERRRCRYASVYPLVTARAVARAFTYEVDGRRREGRDRRRCRSGARRVRGIVVARRRRARPTGSSRSRSTRSSATCRRRSSTSRSGSPTTTARRRPARSRSSRRATPKRRKVQAPPAERQALAGRGRAASRSRPSSSARGRADRRRDRRGRRRRSCSTARPARARPRSTSRRAPRRSSAGSARSCSCPRSRSRRRPSAACARASATASRSSTRG